MYKNFSLTDQERRQILEQHQGKGYKQPLKEYLMGKEREVDENLGMLARIAAPMAASYVGSKMADTNEDFVDTIKSGVNNAVGGLQKGMTTVANTVADTLQSDEAIKKFNDRISAIANVIKYAKKGTDPKTQQPAWMIVNPQSKVNGMRLDVYFKTYNVTAGEVVAARMVNQQGGKPLTGLQRTSSAGNSTYRSSAAHPPTFAKLGFTGQPANVATPKGQPQPPKTTTPTPAQPQPLSELGGYIGDAPEKIDGPFLKEIDPSVYEGVSYVEALYTDILLMRLYRNNLISKDSFNEVRKPIVKIIEILKGEQEEKQKDLPF